MTEGRKERVLFLTENGGGLGHLTRAMAIARRVSPGVSPVFLTMSQGLPIVREQGFMAEYVPTRKQVRCDTETWNWLLEERLREVMEVYDPKVLVLDAVGIFEGLVRLMRSKFDCRYVWCRRGMWKKGKGGELKSNMAAFDLVIEPGEVAESRDKGWTAARRRETARVNPIIFLDESELVDRDAAAKVLGIDPKMPAVLLQLGGGHEEDCKSPAAVFIRRLSKFPGWQIVSAESIIAADLKEPQGAASKTSLYPLSRYYRAFDFVISAAGYNSYHELIGFAVPTIFVPNAHKGTDNQAARAGYARDAGAGLCVEKVTEEAVEESLEIMMDEGRRGQMARRCRKVFPGNGAQSAARAVEALLADGRRSGKGAKTASLTFSGKAMRNLHSLGSRMARASGRDFLRAIAHPLRTGSAVYAILFSRRTLGARRRTTRSASARGSNGDWREWDEIHAYSDCSGGGPESGTVMMVLWDVSTDEMERLVGGLALPGRVRPVFVTNSDAFRVFRRHGRFFEYIPPRAEWVGHNPERDWGRFVSERFDNLVAIYRPRRIFVANGNDSAARGGRDAHFPDDGRKNARTIEQFIK